MAGALGALAGCSATSNDGGGSSEASIPAKGSGYTENDSGKGYIVVDNGEGKQLSYSSDSGLALIEQDGYAFKDFEGTGELVTYEDWRLTAEERAEDLASRLSIEQIAGLMCFSAHQRTVDEVTDEQKTFLDGNVRAVLNAASGYAAYKQTAWANQMQAYVEASDNKIPINFSSDPRNGKNCTNWPGNLGLAASFDPEMAKRTGSGIAKEMREMGISTFLGPQTDVAADPRWARFSGTFGEDPALSRDMCRALIDGLQSTVDDDGNDQGWGTGSLVSMVKHWPAEGAGEGGREGHSDNGKFAVYPNDNFDTLTTPFVEGAFKLDGKTGCAGAIMTSYTIAYSDDEKYGELVGSGFSEYKITTLLREKYGFAGAACTDWGVLNDPHNEAGANWTCWGLEDTSVWTPAKRASKSVGVGVDQMGGCNDPSLLVSAYDDMAAELGKDKADENFKTVAARLLRGYFNTGIFEDPYVDADTTRENIDKNGGDADEAMDAQVKCIVMLKNHNKAIAAREGSDLPKVYVPYRFTPVSKVCSGSAEIKWTENPATCDLPIPEGTLKKYFNLVTDTLAETLTGPADKDGNATPTEADLTRAAIDDIRDCDFVFVVAAAPVNASARRGIDEDGNYIPLSLQYRPYTADSEYVPETSIAGDKLADGTQENRSYFGRTSMVTNENQLDQILDASSLAKEAGIPCIAVLDIMQPMCVGEFEDKVDAILVSMSGCTEAACRIAAGTDEPSGLLPMQMPADMVAVEKQSCDLPRDMDCYVDVDGNEYDFGFGLNYGGAISDSRTEKYRVDVLTGLES